MTTIVGFTETTSERQLYNSAAVFHQGVVAGVYRELHPALRRSVYTPGRELPVFQFNQLIFGIIICNDSNHPELAEALAARGATAVFVPTNNALPRSKTDVVEAARRVDIAVAKQFGLHVVRADVAGVLGDRISYGSSAIVDRDGTVLQTGRRLSEDLLVAELT